MFQELQMIWVNLLKLSESIWKGDAVLSLSKPKFIVEIRNEIKFEVNKAMERERKNIENILWSFQTSVENMFNENKQEIIKLKQIVGI